MLRFNSYSLCPLRNYQRNFIGRDWLVSQSTWIKCIGCIFSRAMFNKQIVFALAISSQLIVGSYTYEIFSRGIDRMRTFDFSFTLLRKAVSGQKLDLMQHNTICSQLSASPLCFLKLIVPNLRNIQLEPLWVFSRRHRRQNHLGWLVGFLRLVMENFQCQTSLTGSKKNTNWFSLWETQSTTVYNT